MVQVVISLVSVARYTISRTYNMATWRYKIYLLMLKNILLIHFTHLWNIFQHSKRNSVSTCLAAMQFPVCWQNTCDVKFVIFPRKFIQENLLPNILQCTAQFQLIYTCVAVQSWGWGGLQHKNAGVCLLFIVGVKITVLVSLRVFGVKMSTAGVFAVPFRVLSWKSTCMTGDNVLCKNPYLLRSETISSHTH